MKKFTFLLFIFILSMKSIDAGFHKPLSKEVATSRLTAFLDRNHPHYQNFIINLWDNALDLKSFFDLDAPFDNYHFLIALSQCHFLEHILIPTHLLFEKYPKYAYKALKNYIEALKNLPFIQKLALDEPLYLKKTHRAHLIDELLPHVISLKVFYEKSVSAPCNWKTRDINHFYNPSFQIINTAEHQEAVKWDIINKPDDEITWQDLITLTKPTVPNPKFHFSQIMTYNHIIFLSDVVNSQNHESILNQGYRIVSCILRGREWQQYFVLNYKVLSSGYIAFILKYQTQKQPLFEAYRIPLVSSIAPLQTPHQETAAPLPEALPAEQAQTQVPDAYIHHPVSSHDASQRFPKVLPLKTQGMSSSKSHLPVGQSRAPGSLDLPIQ